MNGSSLVDMTQGADESASKEVRRGFSSEESLADRLRLEFNAPIGLIDLPTSSWKARLGAPVDSFPDTDACLTAALSSGIHAHGRAFIWRADRNVDRIWLCLMVQRPTGGGMLALAGFDAYDETEPPRHTSNAEKARAGWGRACNPRALRAWGQSVSDELRGEAFKRSITTTVRSEQSERQLVPRLIRRMRMSDSPIQFQDLALRSLKATLNLGAAVWVPSSDREPVVMAGGVDGFAEMDFRSLTESAGEDAIFVSNDPNTSPTSGLRRYAIVAADTKASSGWLIAINPLDQRPLGVADVELLQPIASLIGSQRANGRLYRELKDMLFGIIRSLTAAIDAKDTYTNGHSLRVARIAVKLAEELGMSSHQRGDIYLMGLLHDVGKIGIKDEVLKKNGALTPDEYREIKRHVEIGVDILKDLTKLHHLLPAVRHHHEAYDGSGYPDSLQGEEIPFEARILAVADAFDAMASDRPYRKGLGQSRMRQIFKEGAARQWDPSIVEALFERWEDIADITAKQSGKTLAQVVDDNLKQGSSSRRISPAARGGPAVSDL